MIEEVRALDAGGQPPHDLRRPPPLSRRALLTGGLSTGLLVACGSSSGHRGATKPRAGPDVLRHSLVAFFGGPDAVQAGIDQRVTFGLGDAQGAIISDGPTSLEIEVLLENRVVDRVTAARHREGLARSYYPLTFRPATAGVYAAQTIIEGEKIVATFVVAGKVAIPQVGHPMVVVDTPTTAHHRGVNPICTRSPVCPLHEVNLRDALEAHKPVAFLMATPAYCQTAICGPVLAVLLSQHAEFGDRIQMIHSEVYADGRKAAADIDKAVLSPALRAYHLPFEPSLFVSRADGTIAARLDTTFDRAELRAALRSVG